MSRIVKAAYCQKMLSTLCSLLSILKLVCSFTDAHAGDFLQPELALNLFKHAHLPIRKDRMCTVSLSERAFMAASMHAVTALCTCPNRRLFFILQWHCGNQTSCAP